MMLLITDVAAITFYFMVYAFFGWILENCTSLLTTGKFFKANFFIGPFKPMYGFAPLFLIILLIPDSSWFSIILLCLLIPTTVEYVSGFLLMTFFKRRWWDYSRQPLNVQGYICPVYSLCWLFLSLICLQFIQPLTSQIYIHLQHGWTVLYPFVLAYFFGEFIFAVKRHLPERTSPREQTT